MSEQPDMTPFMAWISAGASTGKPVVQVLVEPGGYMYLGHWQEYPKGGVQEAGGGHFKKRWGARYWALTLEESLKQAEEHRRNRIASLRKQIAKLEAADLSPARSADG